MVVLDEGVCYSSMLTHSCSCYIVVLGSIILAANQSSLPVVVATPVDFVVLCIGW